jgi:peroxiredoxin
MRKAVFAVAGILALGVAVGMQGARVLNAGDAAPSFSARGTDGKSYTLASLTKSGPVFFYFIQDGCPVNDQAAPHVHKVADAYRGKATFIGIMDSNEATAKRWASKFKATYPILPDPDQKIIKSFRAQASPWLIQVGRDGKVAKVWEGYSQGYLNELNANAARAANTTPSKLDFSAAPARPRYG